MASSSVKDRRHGRGDLASCVEAFESEFDYIHKALRRHGISESDADDLAQEVFLIMWRRWADYDSGRPVRPWLAGIAFRVAYNHRDRIAREVPGGLLDTHAQTETPEDRIASGRVRALVLQALAHIPEKQRAAMILHHLDGLGVRDVARVTKVPLFTAYSRLRAGRRAFAAAVRRLSTIAGASPLPRPEALLRSAPAAARPPSEQSRRKVMSRARALMLLPGVVERPRSPAPAAASGPSLLPLAAAGLLVASTAALGFVIWEQVAHVAPAVAEARGAETAGLPPLMVPGRSAAISAAVAGAGRRPAPVLAPEVVLGRRAPMRLTEGMVAYWRFDEGRTTPAVVDLSGHANDCVPQRLDPRSDWVAGPHGGALHLGGRGWLVCPAVDPMARGGEELTIAIWIKRTGPDDRLRALVSRQMGRRGRDNIFFGLRDGKLLLSSDLWRVRLTSPAALPRDRWVHVAASRDRDRLARLYIDGEEVARQRTGLSVPAGVRNPLVIGASMNRPPPSVPSERFPGALDELVMYDRALTPQEVAALAAGTQPSLSL
jgi:RNA polymerase sigma-70 factor (ECF subfamily)